MNLGKTKVMVIHTSEATKWQTTFTLTGEQVEVVGSYFYLGITFKGTSRRFSIVELAKDRVTRGYTAVGALERQFHQSCSFWISRHWPASQRVRRALPDSDCSSQAGRRQPRQRLLPRTIPTRSQSCLEDCLQVGMYPILDLENPLACHYLLLIWSRHKLPSLVINERLIFLIHSLFPFCPLARSSSLLKASWFIFLDK